MGTTIARNNLSEVKSARCLVSLIERRGRSRLSHPFIAQSMSHVNKPSRFRQEPATRRFNTSISTDLNIMRLERDEQVDETMILLLV